MPRKFKEHICSCEECKSMCHHVPCTGTPAETEKLIDLGYADKLTGANYYANGKDVNFLRPRGDGWLGAGRCLFLTKAGLCSLHKRGLKPLEGRIAIHGAGSGGAKKTHVVKTWDTPEGKRVFEKFKAIETEMIKEEMKRKIKKAKANG